MEYQFHTLSNGIRLVHRHSSDHAAHCGIFIDAGSRDEEDFENGMAHFIEHTIFKGTSNRKAYHILNRLESVGGDLNAYTTKEETCIYASFLYQHYDRALELIADLIRNSTFPEKELEKEKDVIIDEINSYKDNPSEEIYDLFEEYLFPDHPLGRNILGSENGLRGITRNKIMSFISRTYHPEHMVLCSVGNISWNSMIRKAEKYYSSIESNGEFKPRQAAIQPDIFTKEFSKPIFQTHCVTGNTSFGRDDDRKYAMFLLNNILGGPALNSKLNLIIREKYGYSYHVESNYHTYSDTGIFSVYLGTVNGYLDKSLSLLNKELKLSRNKALTSIQLEKAKRQARGQMALSYESNLNKMLVAGKGLLHDQEVLTLPEMHHRIESISSGDILEAANIVFDPSKMSTLIYKSTES